MPNLPLESPILTLYLQISQYPILARQIRHRMRDELYQRGVATPERFEQEVRDKAILSQHREGLTDPYAEEDERAWEQRLQEIRDHLTDFYFAYNLPMELFHRIVEEMVSNRSARRGEEAHAVEVRLTFNPELAPADLLLRQAEQYESLPEAERAAIRHHLEEIIVVLTKTMISDQLSFVRVAKAWFTAADFKFIQSHRIGSGKVGGKAAGMLLAHAILQRATPDLAAQVTVPRSYFVGADVFYDFKALNELGYINQKYKPVEQIRDEYPRVQSTYERGRFPEGIADRLREVLDEVGQTPLIVRSSSLLEDNFGTSFAGKYASFFCPNQSTPDDNLRELILAIQRIYASVYSPDVLIYRRRMGLLDYDERMAILLQEVQGERHRRYFFPALAGVAFSHSPVVWSPRLRREEGFLRMVLGLGTRAVERVGEDYARLVFLSHPLLRPENSPDAVEHYSQRLVDVIDLGANAFKTVPARDVLDRDYPALRWVASLKDADTLLPLRRLGPEVAPERLVLTFDNLLQRTDFVALMKRVLSTLDEQYGRPVDVEFALTLNPDSQSDRPRLTFHMLQCRPQSTQDVREGVVRALPADLPEADKLFQSAHMVPQGEVSGVEVVVYVDPEGYDRLADLARRAEVARWVGQLNKVLEGRSFILLGPGRWGSSNLQLGVPVSYADIYNARALVELILGPEGQAPDPSYGTHFFQDLVEAHIYSLAICLDGRAESGDFLNRAFLANAPNVLTNVLPGVAGYPDCLKVIEVPAERPGQRVEILMNGEKALAYFATHTPD
ncbi:MAG: PEP/pyruvate-binding domain-containing protein [Anaerolineales bacterium]